MIIAALLMALPVHALEPGEALQDPAQETRARALMTELRCLVCQSETIEASPSPFAAEVRTLVREQVASGRTDREIKTFLSTRYGDAILYRPRMGPGTWLLWLGPFLLLSIGAVIVVIFVRGVGGKPREELLSDEEQSQLDKMLHPEDDA